MGAALQRIQRLGITHIMVEDLAPMANIERGAGFTQPYSRCCKGNCGSGDEVCNDPSNHVIFDSIHPTQAAWKAVTDLYTYSQSYTVGPTLALWKLNNNL